MVLGNLNLLIQKLGYLTQTPYTQPQTSPTLPRRYLLADDGVTILTDDTGTQILFNE